MNSSSLKVVAVWLGVGVIFTHKFDVLPHKLRCVLFPFAGYLIWPNDWIWTDA